MPAISRTGLGSAYFFTQNRSDNGGNDRMKMACGFPNGCSGITNYIDICGKLLSLPGLAKGLFIPVLHGFFLN